jgi:hypothetical protein
MLEIFETEYHTHLPKDLRLEMVKVKATKEIETYP